MMEIVKQSGFTLVELMVSLTVASILSIALMTSFASQNSIYIKQAQRMQSNDDARQSFEILSRLFRQAEAGSVNIVNTTNINGTDILVSFSLPSGFMIWPNTTNPFTNNFVHIKWADNSVGDNAAYRIRIASSNSATLPQDGDFVVLTGGNAGLVTRISGFNLAAQPDGVNYKMTVVARNGSTTSTAETYFDGFVLPRN